MVGSSSSDLDKRTGPNLEPIRILLLLKFIVHHTIAPIELILQILNLIPIAFYFDFS